MNKYCFLILLFFILSCHEKKAAALIDKPADAMNFFGMFSKLKLPYHTSDTSLTGVADTTSISYSFLHQFVPDSALHFPSKKNIAQTVFRPLGKIENQNELYVLMTATTGKQTRLFTVLFDNKQYISSLSLLSGANNNGYVYNIDINTEPTFTITKTKTLNDEYHYTKNGFAYNSEAKGFIEVINETNEENKKNKDILNPVDTLAKTFKYSGDFTKDKKNFISIRDGNIAGRYIFFLHFEKNKGECTGELKGSLKMVAVNKAVFQDSGDPCVIDFTFVKNTVKVKERGSCGNHRGITCMFDDTYKKKESSRRPLKGIKKK